MKKRKLNWSLLKKFFAVMITCCLAFTLFGCKENEEKPDPITPVENQKFDVTFDSKGGTNVNKQTVDNGGKVVEPKDPTRTNYSFGGWFTDENCTVPFNFDTDTITKTTTLYAKWTSTLAPKPDDITISIRATGETLTRETTIDIYADVTGTTDTAVTWSYSDSTLVKVENNKLSVLKDITVDTTVTVTATLDKDNTKTASKTFTVKAPVISGEVNELTSDMITYIGNESITIIGEVTDYYQDFNNSTNNTTHRYTMGVSMAKDAWYGTWHTKGSTSDVISDNYRKGDAEGRDQYGNTGHVLEKLYIDKNNEVSRVAVKDYLSMPSIWEAQHLWNHLGNLNVNKFTYDAVNNVYRYGADLESAEDAYLMTYLAFSLTPMLEDTLVELWLKVDGTGITELIAQTEMLYYGSDTREEADALSYTEIRLTFSNVGTTVVADPTPYAAPANAEKLQTALEKMGTAKNFSFNVVDVTTSAPTTDSGDYELESLSATNASGATLRTAAARTGESQSSVKDYNSSVGTVGRVAYVTENAALFADTTEYTYTMDGKPYRTVYTGLKQNTDGTYDEFAYDSESGALKGTKRVYGNMFDALPKFEFSPNIFKYRGSSTTAGGKTTYTFVLSDSSITKAIAMEISAYKNADCASASVRSSLTITVDDDGNLVSTSFPYSINYGTYTGYCTTTYYNVGTTTIEESVFNGYQPRPVRTSWTQYDIKYYSPTHSTKDPYVQATTAEVFTRIFGDAASQIPSPDKFMEIFGDNISGPFFDWDEKGTDSSGNTTYIEYVTIKTQSPYYDENLQIENFDELMEEIKTVLEAAGFQISYANTDVSGGATGRSDRYITFVTEDVMIVISNNHTRWLDIKFYKTGDWTLNRA